MYLLHPCFRLLLFKISQRISFAMNIDVESVIKMYYGVPSLGLVPAHLLVQLIDLPPVLISASVFPFAACHLLLSFVSSLV